jgi:hypothetical protein
MRDDRDLRRQACFSVGEVSPTKFGPGCQRVRDSAARCGGLATTPCVAVSNFTGSKRRFVAPVSPHELRLSCLVHLASRWAGVFIEWRWRQVIRSRDSIAEKVEKALLATTVVQWIRP